MRHYGYVAVTIGLFLESLGLPLPGESLMIGASLYAAATHRLSIFVLVPLAAVGAIAGDQVGYWIGHSIGARVLARWGRKFGLGAERLALGRFLFQRYGGFVVFLGRFVAVLRTFVAILAGANRMAWPVFLLWNALGGVAWTGLYGFGAFLLGDAVKRISGPVGIVIALIAGVGAVAGFILVKRNETRLLERARAEMKSRGRATGATRA